MVIAKWEQCAKRIALYKRKHMLFLFFFFYFFPVACCNLKSKNSIVLLSAQISISKPDSDVRGVRGGPGAHFFSMSVPTFFYLTQSSFLQIQYPLKQLNQVCWFACLLEKHRGRAKLLTVPV